MDAFTPIPALIGGLLIGAQGLFNADTPAPVMMGVLLAGGILRSVFFTGSNALGYAEVDDEEASQATAIVAVGQQLSVAFGVAVAGAILEISTRLHGGELTLIDFQIAFFVVGGFSALATAIYFRLPADAGSNVSGHRGAVIQKE